mmetsp:Transcript_4856/g.17598  ORF Transcript_4856/g.17598 Transcript_4856/m.17598 type:complete len:1806 (+) Transcript_4856:266-5683(+)
MGNTVGLQASPSTTLLQDLPSFSVHRSLGGGRLLKTVQCVHYEGFVVVKVFVKRGKEEIPGLQQHRYRLLSIRERLLRVRERGHVWPFQRFVETDKAVYLIRQYFFSSLSQRLYTRPFLSDIEKKWLAFQLIAAVAQAHELGVCHGDIKCENVLLTSWNYAYLSDFASFKKTYLPADNPADFSFFFDTGSRRRCYLAPERFYDAGNPPADGEGAPLQPAMDVFSMGCVIAELFLEGEALFDLGQLLRYRNGQHSPLPALQRIPDEHIRKMVLHMINPEAAARLPAQAYLTAFGERIFPAYFSLRWHSFFADLLPCDADERVANVSSELGELCRAMTSGGLTPSTLADADALQLSLADQPVPGASGDAGAATVPADGDVDESGDAHGPAGSAADDGAVVSPMVELSSLLQQCEQLSASIQHSMLIGPEQSVPSLQLQQQHHQPVEELAMERVAEYQGLDSGGRFTEKPFEEGGSSKSVAQRLRGVTLPAAQGWRWTSAWRIEHRELVVEEKLDGGVGDDHFLLQDDGDSGGWQYKVGDSGEWVDQLANTAGAVQRRRFWVRERRRTLLAKRGGKKPPLLQQQLLLQPPRGSASALGLDSVLIDADSMDLLNEDGAEEDSNLLQPEDADSLSNPDEEHAKTTSLALEALEGVPRERKQGLVLLVSLICVSLRNTRHSTSKLRALSMLRQLARHCDDNVRLQRLLPYAVSVASDPCAYVRAAALRTVVASAQQVVEFPPSDAKLFPEYVLPSLSLLPKDSEELVRVEYAKSLSALCDKSLFFLTQAQLHDSQSHEAHEQQRQAHQQQPPTGGGENGAASPREVEQEAPPSAARTKSDSSNNSPSYEVHYGQELQALRGTISKVLLELTTEQPMGAAPTTAETATTGGNSETRRTLLNDAAQLCEFLGHAQSNNALLPLLVTFLNHKEWRLRAAFLKGIAEMGALVGRINLENFLVPCVEQALGDAEEAVVLAALECLQHLTRQQLLTRRVLLPPLRTFVRPLLGHPSFALRAAALRVAVAAAHALGAVDAHVFLRPLLAPALAREPAELGSVDLLREALHPPVSFHTYLQLVNCEFQRKVLGTWSEGAAGPELEEPAARLLASYVQQLNGSALSELIERLPYYVALIQDTNQRHSVPIVKEVEAYTPSEQALSAVQAPLYKVQVVDSPPQQPNMPPSAAPSRMHRWVATSSRLLAPTTTPATTRRSAAPASTIDMLQAQLSTDEPLSFLTGLPAAAPGAGQQQAAARRLQTSESVPRVGSGGGAQLVAHPAADWQPKGIQVAHFHEHTQRVNSLSVSPDQSFVASACNDGRVKLWNLRKLDKDICFRSNATFNGVGDCVSSCVAMEPTLVACGSTNGSVHLLHTTRGSMASGSASRGTTTNTTHDSGGSKGEHIMLNSVTQLRDFGSEAVRAMRKLSPHVLLVTTQDGNLHAIDVRTRRDGLTLRGDISQGPMERLATDPLGAWCVTGTSRGALVLWDFRFQLQVNAFSHPAQQPIHALETCLGSPGVDNGGDSSANSGSKSDAARLSKPTVLVACGPGELSVWDPVAGVCVGCMQTVPPAGAAATAQATALADPALPTALRRAPAPPRASASASWSSTTSSSSSSASLAVPTTSASGGAGWWQEPPAPGLRAVVPLVCSSSREPVVLAGGSDRVVRYWDTGRASRSFVVCGPSVTAKAGGGRDHDGERPPDAAVQFTREMVTPKSATMGSSAGVPVLRERWPCSSSSSSSSRHVADDASTTLVSTAADGTTRQVTRAEQVASAGGDRAWEDGCHRDCISAMAVAALGDAGGTFLISASRDGVVKVWT